MSPDLLPLSVAALARHLGVHRNTAARWLASGRIPSTVDGDGRRFTTLALIRAAQETSGARAARGAA